MTKHMFIIPLMALSIAGAADTACAMNGRTDGCKSGKPIKPSKSQYRVRCKDVAKNDLNKTTDYPGCMSKERTSREQLQKEWASYSADMHSNACTLVTPPAIQSYVTLQECLKMARDARNMTKNDGATEIGKTMQAPSRE